MSTTRMLLAAMCISLVLISAGQRLAADEKAEPAARLLIREVEEQLAKLRDHLRTQHGLRDVARHDDAHQARALANELVEATQADIAALVAKRDLLIREAAESALMKSILQSLVEADRIRSKTTSLFTQVEMLQKVLQSENQVIREEASRRTHRSDPLAELLKQEAAQAHTTNEPVEFEPEPEPQADKLVQPEPIEPEPIEPEPAPATPEDEPGEKRPRFIEKGDIIIAMNSVEISTVSQFYRLVNSIPAGEPVDFILGRGPRMFRAEVTTLSRAGALRSIGFSAGRRPGTSAVFVLRILPTPSGSPATSLAARTHTR